MQIDKNKQDEFCFRVYDKDTNKFSFETTTDRIINIRIWNIFKYWIKAVATDELIYITFYNFNTAWHKFESNKDYNVDIKGMYNM